jgi:hypothetical protein
LSKEKSYIVETILFLAQVYHCLAQIEAENPDLADVSAALLFKLKLSPNARFAMGTTSMAQLRDVMISSS